MNMPLPLVASLLLGSVVLACMPAHGALLESDEIPTATSAQLRATYLECDRRSSMYLMDLDFMIRCQKVGDALKERDFGGDFERQLQWWRAARGSYLRRRRDPRGTGRVQQVSRCAACSRSMPVRLNPRSAALPLRPRGMSGYPAPFLAAAPHAADLYTSAIRSVTPGSIPD